MVEKQRTLLIGGTIATDGNHRRILVAGPPRSGTTWVGAVLGRVEDARLVHEPDNELIDPFALRAKAGLGRYPVLFADDIARDYERLWGSALTSGLRPRSLRTLLSLGGLRVAPIQWVDRIVAGDRNLQARSLHGALRLLAQPRQAGGASQLLVVKSVHSAFALDFLTSRWPMDVIIVFRNPLNAIASWLEMGFQPRHFEHDDRIRTRVIERLGLPEPNGSDHVTGVAYTYMVLTASLRAAAAANPHWQTVVHEDLCANPVLGFAQLFAELGLPFSRPIAKWIRSSDREGSAFETNRVASEQTNRWRRRLSPEQVRKILAMAESFGLPTQLGEREV